MPNKGVAGDRVTHFGRVKPFRLFSSVKRPRSALTPCEPLDERLWHIPGRRHFVSSLNRHIAAYISDRRCLPQPLRWRSRHFLATPRWWNGRVTSEQTTAFRVNRSCTFSSKSTPGSWSWWGGQWDRDIPVDNRRLCWTFHFSCRAVRERMGFICPNSSDLNFYLFVWRLT